MVWLSQKIQLLRLEIKDTYLAIPKAEKETRVLVGCVSKGYHVDNTALANSYCSLRSFVGDVSEFDSCYFPVACKKPTWNRLHPIDICNTLVLPVECHHNLQLIVIN